MRSHPFRSTAWFALAVAAMLTVPALANDPATLAELAPALRTVRSTGQPTAQELEHAAEGGVRTVINLRTDGEPGFEWEAAAVERLGLLYVHIPIGGPGDLTRENVARFDAALDAAIARGPVLVHCASGNRNGALFALREAWRESTPPDRALAIGRAAGLTGLEPAVRTLLGLPALETEPAGTAPQR
jgi:uncharacterized protein (TIGR01244 family)